MGLAQFYSVFHQQTPEMDETTVFQIGLLQTIQKYSKTKNFSQNFINFHAFHFPKDQHWLKKAKIKNISG